jgi:Gram-negative bacterial TonB protein C-terminal
VIQMDVPAARVVELTSTSHTASFVLLSGEQVLKSNAMTIHVRRSVRVPGDHWLVWRAHKKVVLGGLTSRVDPQIPHAPAAGYGTITIQATIAEDGQVINVKPMNGNLAFLPDVTAAVNEWRYEPTYVDNRQVETQAEIEVDFHPVATLRASKR